MPWSWGNNSQPEAFGSYAPGQLVLFYPNLLAAALAVQQGGKPLAWQQSAQEIHHFELLTSQVARLTADAGAASNTTWATSSGGVAWRGWLPQHSLKQLSKETAYAGMKRKADCPSG